MNKLIGGEFELNSVPSGSTQGLSKFTNFTGTWTINGRSALYLILQQLKIQGVNHIHLPAFLCKSILQPVLALDLDYSFYPVKSDLTALPNPPLNSAVLLIHYFGYINNAADRLRKDSGNGYLLIEDACHVFLNDSYFNKAENQFVFFSTRKHGPTVLGGWCNIEQDLDDPSKDIEVCTWKSLVARLMKSTYLSNKDGEVDLDLENYYLELFQELEEFFDSGIHPTKPPQIIVNIIDNIHWDYVVKQRRTNWQTLRELTKDNVESFSCKLPDESVPLGYVIRLKNRDTVKAKLAAKRIFAPVHWQLPDEIDIKMFPDSAKLADSLLTLPIDQRYGPSDMNYLANVLKEII